MTKPNTPKTKGPAILIGGSLAGVLALAAVFSTQNEAVRLDVYPDPLHGWKVPTVCMGETGPHITRDTPRQTLQQCLDRMEPRHRKLAYQVLGCMSGEVTPAQLLAPMDLADNVGFALVCNSTMLKQQRAGEPPEVWCRQFTTARASYAPFGKPVKAENMVIEPIGWVRGAGRNCRDRRNNCYGLVIRREKAERLCLGDYTVIGDGKP